LAYLFYIAFASVLDESSKLEYKSNESLPPNSNYDEDDCNEDLEPEASQESIEEFDGITWSPQAQMNTERLAQLYRDIKASTELLDPTYQKLPRA
jgi:hypothetical protein